MASSGDEFGSFEPSPQVNARFVSVPVAGPSKRRKNTEQSASADAAGNNAASTDPISISSDEEERPRSKAKRGRIAPVPPTNGRPTASKGKGRSPAPAVGPSRRNKATVHSTNGVEKAAGETDEDGGMSRGDHRSGRAHVKEGSATGVEAKMALLKKACYDMAQQRDNMAKELEQVFQLRETETERLKDEMKAQYETRLKGPLEDTIHEYESLSRKDAFSQSGSSTLHFLTRETADQEKQEIQKEIAKLKNIVKEKDALIARKDTENRELEDTVRTLRADLKAEIDNTKALTSRNHPPSSSKQAHKPDPKHAMVIRLYEELTGVLVTNVRHEPGQFKEDDAIYTCVQTTCNDRSLNFTLKFFKEFEESDAPRKGDDPVDKVIYTPQFLDMESREFVDQMDFLAQPFTFQKSQMRVFTNTLTSYLEHDDNQSMSQADMEDD
ncbi:hypothetical protein BU17DRAFT_97470 [Hysterangium stoloniferum]|nr:hypothetical protein BU17DRAFT_97470 [Hysterangium stoloniferum]